MNVGKISYEISMQGNLISQVFWIFLVVTEEEMVSCSRAFQKAKKTEEERKLI